MYDVRGSSAKGTPTYGLAVL